MQGHAYGQPSLTMQREMGSRLEEDLASEPAADEFPCTVSMGVAVLNATPNHFMSRARSVHQRWGGVPLVVDDREPGHEEGNFTSSQPLFSVKKSGQSGQSVRSAGCTSKIVSETSAATGVANVVMEALGDSPADRGEPTSHVSNKSDAGTIKGNASGLRMTWSRQNDNTTASAVGSYISKRSIQLAAARRVRSTFLHGVVSRVWFSCLAIVVVSIHSVLLAVETDWDLGSGPGSVPFALDVLFFVWYAVELLLRLGAYGLQFIYDGWNILDFFLVVIALIDLALSSLESTELLVVFRLVSLARLLRLARLFRHIKPLWLLFCGIVTSMRTVVWAWLLMGLVIYIFGLGFARVLEPYTCEENSDDGLEETDVQVYFGTVGRAMFSVFQCITLEGWMHVADTAVGYEPWLLPSFFLLLATTSWGVMHVVVAVFVNCALEASSVRSADIAKRTQQENALTLRRLCEVFCIADSDGDGALTKDEFRKVLQDPQVERQLNNVGIDRKWAIDLFDILDLDGSKTLDGAEFVEGVLRSAGHAQNKDVIGLRCDVWRASITTTEAIEQTSQYIQERLERSALQLAALKTMARPVLQRASEKAAEGSRIGSPAHEATAVAVKCAGSSEAKGTVFGCTEPSGDAKAFDATASTIAPPEPRPSIENTGGAAGSRMGSDTAGGAGAAPQGISGAAVPRSSSLREGGGNHGNIPNFGQPSAFADEATGGGCAMAGICGIAAIGSLGRGSANINALDASFGSTSNSISVLGNTAGSSSKAGASSTSTGGAHVLGLKPLRSPRPQVLPDS